jgi:hypothetical protein
MSMEGGVEAELDFSTLFNESCVYQFIFSKKLCLQTGFMEGMLEISK